MAVFKKEKTKKEKAITAIKSKKGGGFADILIIKRPLISEKSSRLTNLDKYVFIVAKNANKSEVKKAIEAIYKVSVIFVNIMNIRGKADYFMGKVRPATGFKKAIVTLRKGQKIEVMPT